MISTFLVVVLFGLSILQGCCFSLKKVFLVHSYHKDYHPSILDREGFFRGMFKEGGFYRGRNYELKEIFMNSKFLSPQDTRDIVNQTIREISDFNPDIVVTFDDNAFKFIGREIFNSIPVFFAGINSVLNELNNTDYHFLLDNKQGIGVSGMNEPMYAGKSINFFSSITNKLKTGDVIQIIHDSSFTGISAGNTAKIEIETSEDLDQFKFEYIQISTFQELKELINIANTNSTIKMMYPICSKLIDGSGIVSITEIMSYTAKHSLVPTISGIEYATEVGFFFGFSIDKEAVGEMIGKNTAKILKGKNTIQDFPILVGEDVPFHSHINLNTAKKLGYSFEEEVLSFFDTVYFREDDQKWVIHMIVICNLIGIIIMFSLTLLILSLMLFFVTRYIKKKDEQLNFICALISFMKLDSPPIKKLTIKPRKSSLEKKLTNIVENLRLFYPFIPRSIMHKIEEDEESISSSSIYGSNEYDDYSDSNLSFDEFKNNKIRRRLNGETSLEFKTVTLLTIKLIGMKKGMKQLSTTYIKTLMNKFIEIVDLNVSKNGGIIQNLSGSTIVASFNSCNTVNLPNHFRKACEAGDLIAKKMKKFMDNEIATEVTQKVHGTKVFVDGDDIDVLKGMKTISVVEMIEQLTGTIGSTKSKFFSTLSIDSQSKKPSEEEFKSNDLLELNNKFGTNVLIDEKYLKFVKYHFNHQLVTKLKSRTICTLFIKEKEEENGWLLVVEKSPKEKDNCYQSYNKAFDLFQKGNYKEAKNEIEKYLEKNSTDILGVALKKEIQSTLTLNT